MLHFVFAGHSILEGQSTNQIPYAENNYGPCGSCRGNNDPGFKVIALMKLAMHRMDGTA